MNVPQLGVTREAALAALRQYKEHRSSYDKKDWEIERIYRAISKGRQVISLNEAMLSAGMDDQNRPRLAICEAHAHECLMNANGSYVDFGLPSTLNSFRGPVGRVRVPWTKCGYARAKCTVPRIPPQHRPASDSLSNYHILWEADWTSIPSDPYLLKRIGKDAWVVLAAWDLTDVEMNVLRAHAAQ